jgi:putative ABC transport system permease protein
VNVPGFLLRIAARNVLKNWRHAVGSTLAVAVGFLAIALFNGYLAHFVREVGGMMEERFMMGSLLVEGPGASEAITQVKPDPVLLGQREQEFLDGYLRDHAGEVAAHVRVLFLWGYASTGRASTQFAGWGYDPEGAAAVRRRFAWDAFYGRPLQLAGPDSVQLGRGLGALLDCVPATGEGTTDAKGVIVPRDRPFSCRRPRVQLMSSTKSGQVNVVQPEVVGLVDAGRQQMDVKFLAMPLALAQRLRNTRDVSMYAVLLRDPPAAARFSRDLVAAGRARGIALDAMPWKAHYLGQPFREGMQLLGAFRGLMALVVVALAGMAVFTTMAKAVSERTREIGTLRSLGFLRRHVIGLFALEAALLSAGACAVGLAASLAVTAAVNGAGITYRAGLMSEPIPLGISLDPGSWLFAAAFLVGVAVAAAYLPARRAARARIPDSLAYA